MFLHTLICHIILWICWARILHFTICLRTAPYTDKYINSSENKAYAFSKGYNVFSNFYLKLIFLHPSQSFNKVFNVHYFNYMVHMIMWQALYQLMRYLVWADPQSSYTSQKQSTLSWIQTDNAPHGNECVLITTPSWLQYFLTKNYKNHAKTNIQKVIINW